MNSDCFTVTHLRARNREYDNTSNQQDNRGLYMRAHGTPAQGCVATPPQGKFVRMQRQQTVVDCPRSMVGRVIGKGGETIKALQQYTGAMIQIDQSCEPTKVTVAGSAQSLQLAVSMVRDIVAGNFKGFALLRQLTSGTGPQLPQGYEQFSQAQPVYVEGYGFVPPSQVRGCQQAHCQKMQCSQVLQRTAPVSCCHHKAYCVWNEIA